MITNEVAFVAIAVSDKERARKFYQETLELKPTRTQMDGAWVESFLVFRFEFVDDQFVAVGILNDRHLANRRLNLVIPDIMFV